MVLVLLLLGCPKPTTDPLFPIPGMSADRRSPQREARKKEDPVDVCEASCLRRNLARAVAWDVVVRDCQSACQDAGAKGSRRSAKVP